MRLASRAPACARRSRCSPAAAPRRARRRGTGRAGEGRRRALVRRSRPCATVLQHPRCQNCHIRGRRAAAGRRRPRPRAERAARPRRARRPRRRLRDLPRHGEPAATATARTCRRASRRLAHAAAGAEDGLRRRRARTSSARGSRTRAERRQGHGGARPARDSDPLVLWGWDPGLRPRAGLGAARGVRRRLQELGGRRRARAPWTARGPHRASSPLADALRSRGFPGLPRRDAGTKVVAARCPRNRGLEEDGRTFRGRVQVDEVVPWSVEYRITLDERWVTVTAEASVRQAGHSRQLQLRREASGRWLADGRELEACRGALDVDLGVTPSTNASAIRRSGSRMARAPSSRRPGSASPSWRSSRCPSGTPASASGPTSTRASGTAWSSFTRASRWTEPASSNATRVCSSASTESTAAPARPGLSAATGVYRSLRWPIPSLRGADPALRCSTYHEVRLRCSSLVCASRFGLCHLAVLATPRSRH